MLGTQPERSARGRRILIAEDSGVTQDLLKLLLSERGYAVDVAGDGESALSALRRNAYDVVLMDFHLPKMDGLQVAAAYRCGREEGGRQPRFIAITADMKGLLAHAGNCETFDRVVPKPFDINEICKVIDGDDGAQASHDEAPSAGGTVAPPPPAAEQAAGDAAAREPKAATPHRSGGAANGSRRIAAVVNGHTRLLSEIEALGLRVLRWPEDFSPAMSASGADRDAIVVSRRAGPRELVDIWQRPTLHLLPLIDLTGSLGSRGDVDASRLAYGEGDLITRTVQAFRDRRERLDRALLLTEELGEKLLGRMFVANRALTATYDPSQPGLVRYNTTLEDAAAMREAELLHESGFLRRDFLDRLHVCDRCGSSRFNVREECPDCHSSNLADESYLHHFKCAYQGVESDFRRGDLLICPKCRQELSHFSVDYDKPGIMVKCRACGHAASEPEAGFICLDCGAHYLADVIQTRDVYSYALTDRALAYLETGRALLGHRQRALRFAELPLELIVALNAALRRHDETGAPFALLDISYHNERDIEAEHGRRQFNQTRELFLETLRGVLRKEDKVVKGQRYDFALLSDVAPPEARGSVEAIKQEATATLRLDLGVAIDVFGPEDFS